MAPHLLPESKSCSNFPSLASTAPSVTVKILASNVKPGEKVTITVATFNFKLNKTGIGKAPKKGEGSLPCVPR